MINRWEEIEFTIKRNNNITFKTFLGFKDTLSKENLRLRSHWALGDSAYNLEWVFYPFLASLMLSLRAQCEQNLSDQTITLASEVLIKLYFFWFLFHFLNRGTCDKDGHLKHRTMTLGLIHIQYSDPRFCDLIRVHWPHKIAAWCEQDKFYNVLNP